MDYDLNAKLCDFGLTQSMEKTHISRRDNEGGSPRYMAPELFDSRGKITEKARFRHHDRLQMLASEA